MLPWKLRKRQILPVNQNFSSLYFPRDKFVSSNLSLAMKQVTYTHKLPKQCAATLSVEGKLFYWLKNLESETKRASV